MTGEEVAALLEQVAGQPVLDAAEKLAAAGVHAMVIWTGPDLDEDEQHWHASALRDARACGQHHHYWNTDWTGLAFYGPTAAEDARRACDAAEKWTPPDWRVGMGPWPEPDGVREAAIAVQVSLAKLLADNEEIADGATRVTVTAADPADLHEIGSSVYTLTRAGELPSPYRQRSDNSARQVVCVWRAGPGVPEAAARLVQALEGRNPGSWTIETEGPVAQP